MASMSRLKPELSGLSANSAVRNVKQFGVDVTLSVAKGLSD